nr:DNA polymerase-like [Tanacetum cinerariifolium]
MTIFSGSRMSIRCLSTQSQNQNWVYRNLKENLNGVNLEDDTKYAISEFFKNFYADLEQKAELIKEEFKDMSDKVLYEMIHGIEALGTPKELASNICPRLGGIMQRAQEIFYEEFEIDIKSKITLPSLALFIFHKQFYDDNQWRIYIPSQNADQFIRKGYYEGHADAYIPYGYYGGHADAYIPFGENLYYYDVNSLYPIVMKEYPMPGGKARWIDSIEEEHLDTMLGFVLAYVERPTDIKRPFLPYRDATGTLIFPTGKFSGVYYTEELKYAKNLGYKINMLYGYFYERKESPFKEIISVLYKKRLEAKNAGHIAVSYVYKILMNSLYGRFGINPLSSKTLIGVSLLDQWKPPSNSAVQLAVAITASVRIHMYPYISRDDCYYTDTDSVVLGNPLNEEELSPTELGKFKEEAQIKIGYFLAPKQYYYKDKKEDKKTLKHKGAAKNYVKKETFEDIYKEPFQKNTSRGGKRL